MAGLFSDTFSSDTSAAPQDDTVPVAEDDGGGNNSTVEDGGDGAAGGRLDGPYDEPQSDSATISADDSFAG